METVTQGSHNQGLSCFIIGNYGDFNVGDEMLLKQVIKEISSEYPGEYNFYVPVRDTGFVKTYHEELLGQVTPIYIKDFKAIFKALASSKIVVVGGGGIWSGDTGFFAHLVPFVSILSKLLLQKKVIYKSIGLYSTASSLDRFFVNLSIAFADICSVRDNESYQMLWHINRKSKATKTEDLSLPLIKSLENKSQDVLLPNIIEYEQILRLRDQGKLIIGISLKSMKDSDLNKKIVRAFSNALNMLNSEHKSDIHFLFFPFAKTPPKTDEEFMQGIIDNLKYRDNVTIVSHTNPIAWYSAIKELTNLFIGMRYHSIIFSFMSGKPVLSIPYERKVIEFLKQQEHLDSPTILPSEINESNIIDFIQNHALSLGM